MMMMMMIFSREFRGGSWDFFPGVQGGSDFPRRIVTRVICTIFWGVTCLKNYIFRFEGYEKMPFFGMRGAEKVEELEIQ
jgi:hypothetical protein